MHVLCNNAARSRKVKTFSAFLTARCNLCQRGRFYDPLDVDGKRNTYFGLPVKCHIFAKKCGISRQVIGLILTWQRLMFRSYGGQHTVTWRHRVIVHRRTVIRRHTATVHGRPDSRTPRPNQLPRKVLTLSRQLLQSARLKLLVFCNVNNTTGWNL